MVASLRGTVRLVLVLVMASVGLLVVSGGASAQFAGEQHPVKNAGNGLCLQPEAGFDSRILQMTCTGKPDQAWTLLGNGGGRYWFVNGAGAGCISVGDIPIDHGIVVAGNCAITDGSGRTASNAQWVATGAVPGNVVLRTWVGRTTNNFCLDVPGASGSPGLAVQLFTCNGTLAQSWRIGLG